MRETSKRGLPLATAARRLMPVGPPCGGPPRHRRPLSGAAWRAGVLGLACILLGACTHPGDGLQPLPPTASETYRLGPGDKLRVLVNGAADISTEYSVSSDGSLAIPLLGQVPANGKAPNELAATIRAAFISQGLFRDPSVAVEVTAYRPVFVLGEVQHPGQYAYQPGMTVLSAVAVAGGFTYRAIKSEFSVTRTTSVATAMEASAARSSVLQPGDVLTIFERRF